MDFTKPLTPTEQNALMVWCRARSPWVSQIIWDPTAETASIDTRGRLTLPIINASTTQRHAIKIRGWFLHETGHPRYQPEIFDIIKSKKIDMNGPFGAVFNLLADVHNETNVAVEFPGDAIAMSQYGAVTAEDFADSFREKGPVKDIDTNMVNILAVMRACIKAEGQWNHGLRIGMDKLSGFYPSRVHEIAEDLESKFSLCTRLVDTKRETEHTLYDLSVKVFDYLKWDKTPQPNGGPSAASAAAASGGKIDTREAGDEDAQECEASGTIEIISLVREDSVDVSDIVRSRHSEGGSSSSVEWDYSNYQFSSRYDLSTPEELIVKDYE